MQIVINQSQSRFKLKLLHISDSRKKIRESLGGKDHHEDQWKGILAVLNEEALYYQRKCYQKFTFDRTWKQQTTFENKFFDRCCMLMRDICQTMHDVKQILPVTVSRFATWLKSLCKGQQKCVSIKTIVSAYGINKGDTQQRCKLKQGLSKCKEQLLFIPCENIIRLIHSQASCSYSAIWTGQPNWTENTTGSSV